MLLIGGPWLIQGGLCHDESMNLSSWMKIKIAETNKLVTIHRVYLWCISKSSVKQNKPFINLLTR